MIHTVQKNETLSKIATRYGVSVTAIQKVNTKLIKDINKIQVGWKLVIPEKDNTKEQLKTVLKDIQSLPSFKKLNEMLG